MKFTMNRNHTVISRLGHAVAFIKGEPTFVPPEMAHEVLAAGAVAEDIEQVEFPDQQPKPAGTPTDPAERTELMKMAIADIVKRDHREDFGSNGAPKVKAVEALLKFDVSAKEINELYAAFNQAKDGK